MVKKASSTDDEEARSTGLPSGDDWPGLPTYEAAPLPEFQPVPAPGTSPASGPPEPSRLLYSPKDNSWFIYAEPRAVWENLMALAMVAAALKAVTKDVRKTLVELEPSRNIWFLYEMFDPKDLDPLAPRRLVHRLLRNTKLRDESSWVNDNGWSLGFTALDPAAPSPEGIGNPRHLSSWIESWEYVVQLWRKVAAQQNPKPNSARLMGELRELSVPDRDEMLREFFLDAEIGPAILRLAEESRGRETLEGSPAKFRTQETRLEQTQREQEEKLHSAMRLRVFGQSEPSFQLFQTYLEGMAKSKMERDSEPSSVVKTINYCRHLPQVQAELFYPFASSPRTKPKLVPCRLKQLTGSRYQLLGLGDYKDVNLYSDSAFPALIARPASA